MKRLKAPGATAIVGISLLALTATGATAFSTPSASVTPYGGGGPSLTLAPYVTDLTQTTAYINWATSSKTPGSVQVAPLVGGACPASVATWSPSSIPVPTSLPSAVNPVAQAPGNGLTGWQFTVAGDTTVSSEYQSSVPVTGLSPGTGYCYAVFSSDGIGATDLMAPSTAPALQAQRVQSFTTLDD